MDHETYEEFFCYGWGAACGQITQKLQSYGTQTGDQFALAMAEYVSELADSPDVPDYVRNAEIAPVDSEQLYPVPF